MRRISRIVIGLVASIGFLVGAAGTAGAGGFPLQLTCGGTTYQVITNGNGDWTPARDSASNLVFHPTAFGEFSGTFTPSDGSAPQHETDPPFARKRTPRNGHPTADCTYHLSFTDEGGTFSGDGSVSGWTSGTRK
jgi:hypothetical protein